MYLKNIPCIALALPLALATACGDDSSTDPVTGGGSTTANTPDATTENTPDVTTGGTPDSTTTDNPATTDDPDSSSGEPAADASVRVLHLGVNAPAVDIFANGTGPVFNGLEFRNSTAYAPVPAGDYTFEVSVSGSPAEEAVLAPELSLEEDTAYTAVAIGDLNETEGAPGLQAIALVDDDTDLGEGDVRITVVHAAPAVGQVDIWEISGDPIPLLEDVDFAAIAPLDDLPAGPLELGIDVNDDAMPDLTFSVDATPLAGTQLNVFANNDENGGVALVIQLPDGTVLAVDPNPS